MLHVDSRERKVIPFFTDPRIKIINNMKKGDYVIVDSEDKIIHLFERKTMKDLVQSMINKTLHIESMESLRSEINCELSFIIEHKTIFYEDETLVYNVKYKKIRALLNSIFIKHKISIIYTKSQEDTAHKLIEFLNLYIERVGKGSSTLLTIKENASTESYVKNMWCCIPGIGEALSFQFMCKYSLMEILYLDVSDLKALKINDKKIGARLVRGLTLCIELNYEVWTKILSKVNGVSKVKAELILKQIDEPDDFAKLPTMKIQDKKIKVIGDRILSYLNFKIHHPHQNQYP